MIASRAIVSSASQNTRRGVSYLRGVGCDSSRASISQVDRQIGTRSDFVQPQIDDRVGAFDENVVGRCAVGVRGVLVMSEDLRGTQLVRVPGEFVNGAEVRIERGVCVIVTTDRE